MDWAGLEAHCLQPFPNSFARPKLCGQLDAFLSELRALGLLGKLWIDGSFVTAKVDPDDVDLLFVPDAACLNEFQKNYARIDALFHQHGAKVQYNCHAFIVDPSDQSSLAYWRGLFGFCHDNVTPKGLVVLSI